MFVIGNLLTGVAQVLNLALNVLMFLILVRALISWVNPDPYNPIVIFLTRVTEPILGPIRRLIPMYNLGIDISPIIAWLLIVFIKAFLVQSLFQLAAMTS